MNKLKLLSALLISGALAISASQGAFAATTASQTVTGTLGAMKQVVTNGGNIAAVIDPDTGTLSLAFTPGFTLTTNTNAAEPLTLTATCNTTTLVQNAFSGDGNPGTTFISLTNNTILPTVAAVTDAKSAAPTPANNADVIAYGVTPPTNIAGQLIYTWDAVNIRWNASLSHKGSTNTALTIPAATPKANTYSFDDDPGNYQATITLSFV